jgi:hypothetical protein
MRKIDSLVLVLVALGALGTDALAQAEPPAAVRSGLISGLSLGPGSHLASCDECGSGLAFDLAIGYMLRPDVALVYDAGSLLHDGGWSSTYTLGAQAWVAPTFWLKAGVGLGGYLAADDSEMQDLGTALAISGAVGHDLLYSDNLALDVSFRLSSAFHDDVTIHSASGLLGVHWY